MNKKILDELLAYIDQQNRFNTVVADGLEATMDGINLDLDREEKLLKYVRNIAERLVDLEKTVARG